MTGGWLAWCLPLLFPIEGGLLMNTPVKQSPREITHKLLASTLLAVLLPLGASAAEPAAATAADSAAAAKAEKEAELLALFQSDSNVTNSLGMVMVHVPQNYRVAQYEVTQTDYQAIMDENPSHFAGAQRPVEQVSWNSARSFCTRLTQKEKDAGLIPPGYSYSLPTEAQWSEYVDDARLEDAISSHLGDRRSTENVGGLPPNKFGLHDTRGNVWEWCATPVARGASWRSHEDYLDLGFRFIGEPDLKYDDIGFRVILQSSE
jgi:formylglycine-generating enzyme required for sulfatase activity